jgi:hypothetical protein
MDLGHRSMIERQADRRQAARGGAGCEFAGVLAGDGETELPCTK